MAKNDKFQMYFHQQINLNQMYPPKLYVFNSVFAVR